MVTMYSSIFVILKTGTFSYFWYNLTKFFKIFLVVMAILVHNSARNYIKQNSDRAKEFTFRMSALYTLRPLNMNVLPAISPRKDIDTSLA